MSLFQSNLPKQIRNLPKILNFVKIIHYFSKLFTGVLNHLDRGVVRDHLREERHVGVEDAFRAVPAVPEGVERPADLPDGVPADRADRHRDLGCK